VTPNRLARTACRFSLALCVVLSAGACAAAGEVASAARPDTQAASPAASNGATPFALPPRTGETLTRTQAARRYLEIVEPRNDAMVAYYDGVEAGLPWTKLRDLAAARVAAEDEEVRQLAGTPWPADVIPFVDTLVRENLDRRPGWVVMAEARSERGFVRGMDIVGRLPEETGETAYRIRELLGLLGSDSSDSFDSFDSPDSPDQV